MAIALVGMADRSQGFNGKISFRRVSTSKTALRRSKHHARGDVYEVDCSLDADAFQKKMQEEVMPDTATAMPFADVVTVQIDGAPAHIGRGKSRLDLPKGCGIERLNQAGAKFKPKIRFERQPGNSPDTNVLDLAVFRALSVRVHEKQRERRAGFYDQDGLWTAMTQAWKELPADAIERAWVDRELALRQIIKHKGRNTFEVPHTKPAERAKILAKLR